MAVVVGVDRCESSKPNANDVQAIVTHGGTAHTDDFLAVAVLLTLFPEATVYRVSKVDEGEFPENTIFVDVGGKYDGERFFDHHHDPNLPCSLILVLKRFFPDVPTDIDELRWIDDWDRLGGPKTQKKWGVKLPEFRDPISASIIDVFSSYTSIPFFDPLHMVLQKIGKSFLEFLRKQGEYLEIARNAEVFEVKGVKVVKLDKGVPVRFIKQVHPDVGVVVQPNQRMPEAMSVIRIDDHPRVDFHRISVPAHFIHPTGFMAVVDPEHVDRALEEAIE